MAHIDLWVLGLHHLLIIQYKYGCVPLGRPYFDPLHIRSHLFLRAYLKSHLFSPESLGFFLVINIKCDFRYCINHRHFSISVCHSQSVIQNALEMGFSCSVTWNRKAFSNIPRPYAGSGHALTAQRILVDLARLFILHSSADGRITSPAISL